MCYVQCNFPSGDQHQRCIPYSCPSFFDLLAYASAYFVRVQSPKIIHFLHFIPHSPIMPLTLLLCSSLSHYERSARLVGKPQTEHLQDKVPAGGAAAKFRGLVLSHEVALRLSTLPPAPLYQVFMAASAAVTEAFTEPPAAASGDAPHAPLVGPQAGGDDDDGFTVVGARRGGGGASPRPQGPTVGSLSHKAIIATLVKTVLNVSPYHRCG